MLLMGKSIGHNSQMICKSIHHNGLKGLQGNHQAFPYRGVQNNIKLMTIEALDMIKVFKLSY